MRSVAETVVRGASTIAVVALMGCGGNHGESPAASPAASRTTTDEAPIDTVGLPRIRFARGTTSGTIDEKLGAGPHSYVLSAQAGQIMLAHAIAWPVENPPPEPLVQVYEATSGRELASPRGEPEVWSGRLPITGDYVVRVTGTAPIYYTLAVQIPRRVELSPAEPTAVFTGTAPSRAPIDFLVRVDAGRTLEVSLGGAPTVGLHIYGLDNGVQFSRLSERQRHYSGRAERTQDYVVSMVPWAERAAYDLRVTVR